MMKSRPRSDIYINLPALQKLDTMLIVRQISIAFLYITSQFSSRFLVVVTNMINTTLFAGNIRYFPGH